MCIFLLINKGDKKGCLPAEYHGFQQDPDAMLLLTAGVLESNFHEWESEVASLRAQKDCLSRLFDAVQTGDHEAVRRRLEARLSIEEVNYADREGWTPLHLMVQQPGTELLLEDLLRRGANVRATNNAGLTPLHVVRSAVGARMLLAHGAPVNSLCLEGRTPLHYIAKTFPDAVIRDDVLECLLVGGADPDIQSHSGETARRQCECVASVIAKLCGAPQHMDKFGTKVVLVVNGDTQTGYKGSSAKVVIGLPAANAEVILVIRHEFARSGDVIPLRAKFAQGDVLAVMESEGQFDPGKGLKIFFRFN